MIKNGTVQVYVSFAICPSRKASWAKEGKGKE